VSGYQLPSKIPSYLRRLRADYDNSNVALFSEILSAARIHVVEETYYDNWNGGINAHDVKIFLPEETLYKINIKDQKDICKKFCDDINACGESIENEYIHSVSIEENDESDIRCQQAVFLSRRQQIMPDSLSFWTPGCIRLFISHRDSHKQHAKALADELEGYGIGAFVAHDTIEPLEEWQHTIRKGLETMEIMLAFVTDDFHGSTWTNQEIGYALGRNIPIISLRLEKSNPQGFLGSIQALKGNIDEARASAFDVYELIAEKLGNGDRLRSALVSSFIQSSDFSETKRRFIRMRDVVSELNDDQVEQIINGFEQNDQINGAWYLVNQPRLQDFLNKTTGRRYQVKGDKIVLMKESISDEIPF